jgi:CRISPR type III-B/RAMP module RAMP protein Cmr1
MGRMELTAQCKIVTPMLSYGANHKRFELRASEVKAALRFWWRAFQPCKTSELFKKESLIFGDALTRSSPFRLRVSPVEKEIMVWDTGENVTDAWGPGIGYILFPIVTQEKKIIKIKPFDENPSESGRPVAKPGVLFDLTFRFNPKQTPIHLGDTLCALWLLENLGGLGGRTRRGAGCFEITRITLNNDALVVVADEEKIKGVEWDKVPRFFPKPGETPSSFLHDGLDRIVSRWKPQERQGAPNYTAYDPKQSQVLVLNNEHPLENALAVMRRIGTRIKDFSADYPSDESGALRNALENETPLPENFSLSKAARGLPISFQYGNPPGSLTYTATTVMCDNKGQPVMENGAYKEGSGRRASPLLISCHEKGGNPYAVLCYFPAPITATEEKLYLKPSKKPSKLSKFLSDPDWTLVRNMMLNRITVKNKDGNDEHHEPILYGFSKRFQLLPKFEEITTGLPRKRQVPKRTLIDEVPAVKDLLGNIKLLNSEDKFRIEKIIAGCYKLDGEDKQEEAGKVASALKEKLKELRLYGKRSPYRADVESFLIAGINE